MQELRELCQVVASHGFSVHAVVLNHPHTMFELGSLGIDDADGPGLSHLLAEFTSRHQGKWWVGSPEIKPSTMDSIDRYIAVHPDDEVVYLSSGRLMGVYVGSGSSDDLRHFLSESR
jgi:hypothetical protein